jgi:hypothetical protein
MITKKKSEKKVYMHMNTVRGSGMEVNVELKHYTLEFKVSSFAP